MGGVCSVHWKNVMNITFLRGKTGRTRSLRTPGCKWGGNIKNGS
jgi:hypothetical protein